MNNQIDFSDSIDDIIGLLNKEGGYKIPEQPVIFSSNDAFKNKNSQNNPKDDKEDYDTLMKFCDKFEKKQEENEKVEQDSQGFKNQILQKKIRFLQFAPWSGKSCTDEKDYGYYYKIINGANKFLISELLEENGFRKSQNNDWTIGWSTCNLQAGQYSQLMAYQKVNHFPRSIEITRKDLLNRNISKMQQIHGMGQFNFIPKTFILPNEAQMFIEDAEKQQKYDIWYISKPSGSSQGKGIFITDNPQEVLNRQQTGSSNVVCHYIKNPLLINNLKFDMRIYVIMTSIHPLRIYIYNEGLIRFATSEYNISKNQLGNVFTHLTNYSINKYSEGFVKNINAEDDFSGSKWSLTSLKDFLRTKGINVEQIFERIEDMLVKTILSIENQIFGAFEMQVPFRNNCFQLFGFDVLIDSNLKPWVLEVNLSPSLNTDSPIDLKIKGNLIADLFTLIGIVPVDQRYIIDTSYCHTSNSNSNDKNFANLMSRAQNMKKNSYSNPSELSNLEKYVIKESEEENGRCRNFKRIYPTPHSAKYKSFFEVERPFNILLWNNELHKVKNQSMNATHQTGKQNQNQNVSYMKNNQNNLVQNSNNVLTKNKLTNITNNSISNK